AIERLQIMCRISASLREKSLAGSMQDRIRNLHEALPAKVAKRSSAKKILAVTTSVDSASRTQRADVLILYAARGLRGFGDGFAGIILRAYLSAIGFSPVQIGFIARASLVGPALLTLAVGFIAPRHDLRTLVLGGALLMAFTGAAFPNFEQFVPIAFISLVGRVI